PEHAEHDAALKLFETLEEGQPLPPLRDPQKLWPRVDWLVQALLGVGTDYRTQLDRAPTFADYADEAPHLATHPHLATYWVLAHHFFDNQEALQDVLQRTEGCEEPVLEQAREFVQDLQAGRRVRIGEHDQAGFAAVKQEILQRAPMTVFEPAAKKRI
ncbi:unnamed protein product, partial [Laminaria digitata]